MKNKLYKKGLVLGIVLVFIGSCLVPGIGGKHSSSKDNEENPLTTSEVSNSATLSLHTFEKTSEKQKKDVEIPADVANEIYALFEELKQKIVYEPRSDETQTLKIKFVDLLDLYDLIPNGLSKEYILSLLNPSWLNNKQKIPRVRPIFPVLRNFVSRIISVFANLQQFFKMRFGKTASQDIIGDNVPTQPFSQTGTAVFCSMGSGGRGSVLPLFLLPRPRGIAVWSATEGVTVAAELLSSSGFGAEGAQSGLVLGFIGVGLTFAYPGEMVYGFFGYALFTSVSADNIVFYPPNEAPVISNENPADGTLDVLLSLSELSFRISDPEGKLMSYSVTTEPDIGSGSGILKTNGVYSVSVSGLEYNKKYTWTVEVKDDQITTEKQFSFCTEIGPPFDPFDDGWQYRKMITIDHTLVDGDLSSFPVLINTVDVDLRDKAQSDGDDILFMDGSGVANRLYHEIEYFDDSTGELVAWVNIPSLSPSEDTIIYMYYGNPSSSDQQFPERVWDSDYVAVYHMDGSSYTEFEDSTVNSFDATNDVGNPSYQHSAKIGYGVEFDGVDDVIHICDDNKFTFADGSGDKPCSFEAWVKKESLSGTIISKFWGESSNEWLFYVNGNEKCSLYTYDTSGIAGMSRQSTNNVNNNTWIYLTATFDGSTTYQGITNYINSIENSGSGKRRPNYNRMRNTNQIVIIGRYGAGFFFDGIMDEIRISNVERSSAWIITSYNTMNNPLSFFSVGPEESAP
jgi:hypothetical protein